jgi:hypothetical protein
MDAVIVLEAGEYISMATRWRITLRPALNIWRTGFSRRFRV